MRRSTGSKFGVLSSYVVMINAVSRWIIEEGNHAVDSWESFNPSEDTHQALRIVALEEPALLVQKFMHRWIFQTAFLRRDGDVMVARMEAERLKDAATR